MYFNVHSLIIGFERLLPPGASPLDSHWLELQRRYGHPLVPGAAGGSHIPGIYPPTSIASDLMARERERLERLGRFLTCSFCVRLAKIFRWQGQ